MTEYNALNFSKFSSDDCHAAVGKTAKLVLTGEIVEAGDSAHGPYVKLKVDERFGFAPDFRIVIDLDALDISDDNRYTNK